ncbi:MAG TPA: PaaI family thioesterase [Acetobacteraceae bacterium]|nr:PaaI family thioesterase [Acetobacteraceae bacterium]
MEANWHAIEHRIREHVAKQGFMAFMGASIDALAPGSCTISLAVRPNLLQQLGYVHGGVVAFLVDNSATIAAATMLRHGQAVLTAEFKLNYLAPAQGERVVARARVIKPGRSMSVSATDIYAIAGDEERHVATALATIAIIAAP